MSRLALRIASSLFMFKALEEIISGVSLLGSVDFLSMVAYFNIFMGALNFFNEKEDIL